MCACALSNTPVVKSRIILIDTEQYTRMCRLVTLDNDRRRVLVSAYAPRDLSKKLKDTF